MSDTAVPEGGPAEAIGEEQTFAAALQQFMEGADMCSTITSFADRCTEHSKALRSGSNMLRIRILFSHA